MEKNFTPCKKIIIGASLTFIILFLNFFTAITYAQVSCNGGTSLFFENFGAGTTPTSSPDILPSGLTYQATDVLAGEGTYRVIDSTNQKPEWQVSGDHTGNDHGDMLVINGQAETFYSHEIDEANGFVPGNYTVSMYIMNVDTLGTCEPDPLLTNMVIDVEYLSSDGTTWVSLGGSPYAAAPIPQTLPSSPTWVELGSAFTLPSTAAFIVKSIKIVLSDGTVGGCGNDFALDDINFSVCPEGGPLPVQFLGISAQQSGTGVNIQWSTAQEINSSSFNVEKSADGNNDWTTVASVNAAGNSSTLKNYSAFDPSPFDGANFYRIKQIDIDDNAAYSNTVSVNVSANQTSVAVLANPFHNSLTLNFSSALNQLVSARLIDITGKQVAAEKWSLNSGTSTKDFSNVSGLQPGLYILNITNDAGEILLNTKVIKQ